MTTRSRGGGAEAHERRQLAPLAAARSRTAEVCGRPSRSSRPAARRRPPGHVASRRRISRPPAGSSAASRATTTQPSGTGSRRCGRHCRRRTRSPWPAGARPRRPCPAMGRGPAGRERASRCWRLPASRWDWRRGRSCGTCASWPAARASICPRTWTGCWARACPRRRPRRRWSRPSRTATVTPGTAAPTSCATIAGDPAPEGPRPDTFGLSGREREVLVLVAQGRTNREIGERLYISQKTVGVHVGNILAKLEVSGRVEAAAVAIRLGLTDRPEPRGVGARRGP